MTTMTDSQLPRDARGVLVALLRAPWTARTWIDTAHVLAGFPIAVLASTVVVTLGVTTFSLAVTAVLAIPFLAALFASSRLFTSWQRSRFRALTGTPIPPLDERYEGDTWLRRLWAQARTPHTWRQLGYHALSGLTSTVSAVLVVGFWAVGAVLGTLLLHGWALPDRTIAGARLHSPAVQVGLTLLGLVLFFTAPWVASVAVAVDVAMARSMLSASRTQQLARRVASLSESRAGVIDAADAERRRIERDLHDGTQQRLVSLAMNLGMTRTTLTDVPEDVRDAIGRAHDEAKLALTELRDVVRGLHPAVLDDLGLDAALSGIAARSPVPARLMVELPDRPSRAVENIAYFVVSEALANVAKHSSASRVDILVEQAGRGPLRIVVADDGQGGADDSRGTGLRGLRQRVGSVDGTLTIDSPTGGPTVLVVELPHLT